MAELKISAQGQTDVGRIRSANQDSFLIDHPQQLYIVADGMGGHAGGEIASKLAIEEVQKFIGTNQDIFSSNDDPDDPKICQELARGVNHASAKIYERALEDPSLKGMGTTATLVKFIGHRAYCAHVGDSRLYLIRTGFLYQITFDHSLVNEQVRAGVITPEEAEIHRLKNVITRSVGYQEEEDVDTTSFDVYDNDILLLCSDGLHGKVNDRELSNLAKERQLDAVDDMIAMANERGGEDNITAILIKITKTDSNDTK